LVSGAVALLLSLALLVVVLRNLGLTDPRFAVALPEGSIRAVIALLLVLLFFIASVFLYSNGRRDTGTVLDPVPRATVDAIPPETLVSVEPSTIDKTMLRVVRHADTAASDDLANKLLTTISTLVVAVAAFYFGANSVQSASRIGTDAPTGEQFAAKIRAALGGGGFAGVTVSVAGGGAVLMGTVTNEASKEEAERAARSVSGMDTVRNKLAVAPLEERAEGQGEEHAEGRRRTLRLKLRARRWSPRTRTLRRRQGQSLIQRRPNSLTTKPRIPTSNGVIQATNPKSWRRQNLAQGRDKSTMYAAIAIASANAPRAIAYTKHRRSRVASFSHERRSVATISAWISVTLASSADRPSTTCSQWTGVAHGRTRRSEVKIDARSTPSATRARSRDGPASKDAIWTQRPIRAVI